MILNKKAPTAVVGAFLGYEAYDTLIQRFKGVC